MTARYRSRLKISVTLTLMPSPSTWAIAGTPASVAGILMKTFCRSTVVHSSLASSTVACVVVREPRVDLDGHPAVDVVRRLVDGLEDVAGGADVVRGDLEDRGVDVGAAGRRAG